MPVACVCMCLPDTLSRASLVLGLISLASLAASVATDHWLYTSEPVANSNSTARVGFLHFKSGLWKCCPLLEENSDNNQTVVLPSMPCIKIPYFTTELQLLQWTEVSLTTSFLKRMRLCTPLLLTSLAFLLVGTLVSLLGHIYADNRTFIAAIIFILAGLTLAVSIVLYISMISDEVRAQSFWDRNIDHRYSYEYGWSFFGASVSFLTGEAAAVAGISAYLRRFPTPDDIVRFIPGMQQRLTDRIHATVKSEAVAAAGAAIAIGVGGTLDLPRPPKRDMTVQTFDSIAVPL